MKAQKMFEALGYEIQPIKEYRTKCFRKYKKDKYNIITFYNDEKFIKNGEDSWYCDYISLDELKAINQQCKELGWLDE